MQKNRYVNYGLVLLAIAFISALILAVVNFATVPVIAANEKKSVELARKKVLPEAKTFDEAATVKAKDLDFIPAKNDAGEIVGYVVSAAEGGYAGPINFVVGIGKDGKLTGLDIISHQETPGLGAKIVNDSWKQLWIGRDVNYEFNKSVDAFAGATITPKAVYTGVKKVLETYNSEVKK